MSYTDEFMEHSLDMYLYSSGEASIVAGIIDELFVEAIKELSVVDFGGTSAVTINQLNSVLPQITRKLRIALEALGIQEVDRMVPFGVFEQTWQVSTFNTLLGVALTKPALTALEIAELAHTGLIEGAPSADWWSKIAADTQINFSRQVRLGVVNNETISDIVRRVRGTSTGKRTSYRLRDGSLRYATEFKGGVMGVTTRDATALVRTSVQQVTQDTQRAFYLANQDVISGIRQISTLDSRTTDVCKRYDNKRFSLPDFKPVGHRLPYNGGTPRHWSCRSSESAEIRQTEDMRRRGIDPNNLPGAKRVSEFGPVPADLNYYDWLEMQPTAYQIKVLGKKRQAAFAEGLPMVDVVKALPPKVLVE